MAKTKKFRLWLGVEAICKRHGGKPDNLPLFLIARARPRVIQRKCGCVIHFHGLGGFRKEVCEESLSALGIPIPKPGTVVEFELKPVKKGKRNA